MVYGDDAIGYMPLMVREIEGKIQMMSILDKVLHSMEKRFLIKYKKEPGTKCARISRNLEPLWNSRTVPYGSSRKTAGGVQFHQKVALLSSIPAYCNK